MSANISLMFLFPWLDWGIDISDFEKIDFLGHWAIFGDFEISFWSIFIPQVKFVANLKPVEYSDSPIFLLKALHFSFQTPCLEPLNLYHS